MENRHVTQALQEMLAELPLEDREEWILLFTERVETLEAEDRKEHRERMDSNVPDGWDGITGHKSDKGPDHGTDSFQEAVKQTQPAASSTKSFPLMAGLVLAALALIEAVIIVFFLISGGGKSDGPAEPADPAIASDSGYTEPVETAWTSEDPQTTPEQQADPTDSAQMPNSNTEPVETAQSSEDIQEPQTTPEQQAKPTDSAQMPNSNTEPVETARPSKDIQEPQTTPEQKASPTGSAQQE